MAIRVIGLVVMIGAVIGVLAVIVGSDSSGDRFGFSMVGISVFLVGTLVWATGTFHGAVGEALPTLVAIDKKLDLLGRMLAARDAPEATEPEAPTAGAAAVEAPRVVVKPPPPPPERVPCPVCGGLIHPEATRCVHCMKKVPARAQA